MTRIDRSISGGTLVTPYGRYAADIAIRDGKIVGIGEEGAFASATEVVDARSKLVIPGVIDGHYHSMDPGRPDRETWATGTGAAAVGGVTTVLDMPLTSPPVVDAQTFGAKKRHASEGAIVDFGLHAGATANNVERIRELWTETEATAVKMFMCFSVAEFPFVEDGDMAAILRGLADVDALAYLHCENNSMLSRLERSLKAAGRKDPMAHLESHPAEAELEAINRALFLIERSGAQAIIAHTTMPEGVHAVRGARSRGIRAWVESCPHYFRLTERDMVEKGPWVKFTPPMRDAASVARMWKLLDAGAIHSIGSDHNAYVKSEKQAGEDDIWLAPNGIPGVETMLPMMLDGANRGLVSVERLVETMAFNPARLFGLFPKKGLIQPGSDADLVLVDMESERTIRSEDLVTKCGWSPYEGVSLKGWPVLTLVRGEVVARDGNLVGTPGYGEFVSRGKSASANRFAM